MPLLTSPRRSMYPIMENDFLNQYVDEDQDQDILPAPANYPDPMSTIQNQLPQNSVISM